MNPRWVVSVLALCSLGGAGGCKQLARMRRGGADAAASSSPTALSSPPTPTVKETEIRFSGTQARVSSFLRGATYELSFFDFPPSTKVTVGSTTLTTSPTGFVVTKIDLAALIARLSPKDAFDPAYRLDPQTKLGLDFGPQAKLSVDLAPIAVSAALRELLKKVPQTPVTLGSAPKGGAHSAVLLGVSAAETIGPAKTVGDIDWVASTDKPPARDGKTCSGYRKSTDAPGGVDHSLVLKLLDEKVAVHEVRTGKLVAEKVFQAPNVCPSGGIGGLKSYASEDEEKAWLRQLLTRR